VLTVLVLCDSLHVTFVIYIYVTCVATGVCIAQHESSLSTTAINRANTDGSVDNGIFQVSSRLFYNKNTKSLVSTEKTPHALSMDSFQKAITAQF
jgi:hypothetical protein